jgi:hypothetical protein
MAVNALKLRVQKVPVTPKSKQWQAVVHIVVASHATDNDGSILLSADCMTSSEVNYWADEMIKELDAIKKKAAKLAWDNRSEAPSN